MTCPTKTPQKLTTTISRQIRVLFIAHDSSLYGAQISLLDIIKNIDRSRFFPVVVAPSHGPFTEAVHQMNVPVATGLVDKWIFRRKPVTLYMLVRNPRLIVRTPALFFRFLFTSPLRIAKLLLFVRRSAVDLVYTNTVTVVDGALVSRIAGKPHIWHLREQVEGNRELLSLIPARWISWIVIHLSDMVAVNSLALKHRMFPGIASDEKITVIHNGVDISQFYYRGNQPPIRESLKIPSDTPLIAICGFIQERKGHATFIRAAAEVRKRSPGAHFLVIGDGDAAYMQKVRELIAALHLERNVHFLGRRDDIPAIFSQINLLIVASEQEPFGRTIIESMAAGKPVVSTRCGGPEEIIDHENTGFLVPIGDHVEMADKIALLLDQPALAEKLGNAGQRRVEEMFNQRDTLRIVENMMQIFFSHVV